MASLETLKLVQIELRIARSMVEHADDGFLLYLIDMAILELERQTHYGDVEVRGPTRLRQYLELNSAGRPRRIRRPERPRSDTATAPRPRSATRCEPSGNGTRRGTLSSNLIRSGPISSLRPPSASIKAACCRPRKSSCAGGIAREEPLKLPQRPRKRQPRVLVDVHENQRGRIHTRLSGNRVQGIAPIASGFRPYSQTNTTPWGCMRQPDKHGCFYFTLE